MAFLLNWAMMLQCFYYFKKLSIWRNSGYCINWRWFFLLFGISALFGGPSHLFYEYTGLAGKLPGWICGIFAISATELAMSMTVSKRYRISFQILIAGKLIATLIALTLYFDFNVIIVHSFGMLLFILFPFIHFTLQKRNELNMMFAGILMLLAALPIRLLGLDIHIWFNRDDIGHIFMMFALFFFYQGVIKFEASLLKSNQQAFQPVMMSPDDFLRKK